MTSMRGPSPEASGEAIGPEGDDSNMGTAPTSGPEATSSQGKRYIGDGVYAIIEYNQVVLTTENGIRVTNRIVLEPEVWFELKRFVEPDHEPHATDAEVQACPICTRRSNTNDELLAALQGLLATSDLNFDSLEPDTVRAIQAARAVIAKVNS